MVNRVIVQTQNEYASMNRAFLKLVFFVGTFIIGLILLFNSQLFGIIFFIPTMLWVILRISKRNNNNNNNNWRRLRKVPDWVYKKMKRKKTNYVNGEHYQYKRERNVYYRKLK